MDYLKQVNDRFGHSTGDDALRWVGECIRRNIRHNLDVGARFGGDEFAVILPETNETGALEAARRITHALAQPSRLPVPVTVSIGISSSEGEFANAEKLMLWADQALYEAKNTRNTIQIYRSEHP
jgi:diguanylate cyclase (GGDEF)-like protein